MKRGTLIGLIAGGIVLVLLWYFVLFAPTSSDLNDTRDQVAAAESQKQELENTIRRLKELSNNATQQQATLGALRAAVPAEPDLGAFILQANDIAAASGIDWLSIAPSPPASTGGAGPTSTIAISIQVNGGFFQVLDYLNRLEDMDRLVIVDTINVSSSSSTGNAGSTGADGTSTDTGSSGGAPDLSVSLSGRMFTGAEAAAPADGSGSSPTPTPTPTTPTPTTQTTPPASSSGTNS